MVAAIGKAPHFEEAICDVGILEQTANYLPQNLRRVTAGQFRVGFAFNLVE